MANTNGRAEGEEGPAVNTEISVVRHDGFPR
jgi:hypothetical protein